MVKAHHSIRTNGVLREVVGERGRQDEKWGVDRNLGTHLWQIILGEEVGEVCKAILETDMVGLRKELIQVAAVAVAAVESLDRQGITRTPYPGEEASDG